MDFVCLGEPDASKAKKCLRSEISASQGCAHAVGGTRSGASARTLLGLGDSCTEIAAPLITSLSGQQFPRLQRSKPPVQRKGEGRQQPGRDLV